MTLAHHTSINGGQHARFSAAHCLQSCVWSSFTCIRESATNRFHHAKPDCCRAQLRAKAVKEATAVQQLVGTAVLLIRLLR